MDGVLAEQGTPLVQDAAGKIAVLVRIHNVQPMSHNGHGQQTVFYCCGMGGSVYAIGKPTNYQGIVGLHLLHKSCRGAHAVIGALARPNQCHGVVGIQVASSFAIEQDRGVFASGLVQPLRIVCLGAEKGVHPIAFHQRDGLLGLYYNCLAFNG